MMKIGLDLMGGDFAPEQAILGLKEYLIEENDSSLDVHFHLIGDEKATQPFMHHLDSYKDRFTLIPSDSVILMNEHPTKALKEKTNSSIAIGFKQLLTEEIQAFASAGNTGAMLVGSLYSVKSIPGILRPTIASPIPNMNGGWSFMLDAGANSDCKAEHLYQFAKIGSLYAKKVLNIDQPRVGLLNIGTEEGKGNLLAQAAYPLFKNSDYIHFIGNIEGRDIFTDQADIIICDGFTGNIILKMAESFYDIFKVERKLEDEFLNRFNYEDFGGTPVLGINANVFIGHGISEAPAFKNMIKNTIDLTRVNLIKSLNQLFKPES